MKPTIAIFIHDPQCETECALGMIDGLVRDFDIRTFGLSNLNYDFLSQFDAVCFPGGMGDADDFYNIFNDMHIEAVQTYVAEGGKYFGICMGAYWAGPAYFDVVVDMDVEQYIESPDADVTHGGPTVADVTWNGKAETMYFYDGCAINSYDMDVVATYTNGEAMAAIQRNVGMIGCHPEALDWWYGLDDIGDYYDPRHAKLMSDFLKRLVNND